MNSMNVPALKTMEKVGIRNVVAWAKYWHSNQAETGAGYRYWLILRATLGTHQCLHHLRKNGTSARTGLRQTRDRPHLC